MNIYAKYLNEFTKSSIKLNEADMDFDDFISEVKEIAGTSGDKLHNPKTSPVLKNYMYSLWINDNGINAEKAWRMFEELNILDSRKIIQYIEEDDDWYVNRLKDKYNISLDDFKQMDEYDQIRIFCEIHNCQYIEGIDYKMYAMLPKYYV
ncbi:hypothetical protein F370_101 [Campylobacter phage F370]|uniref:Uncharacterized protein n=1 Tax=Campylobacter phage F372 TaxID=2794375 RepID=A0A7T3KHJ5_9CAUD|nr:hypothetical protein F370_101 [Campylobacter phage F370]QPX65221.1 hypothetical protein F371_103 [Campylobacter phage F371]QPX65381.1 hypothetical protein F372_099 [Campylobacter phage F372]